MSTQKINADKPIGKSYGSIPHLPGSRVGQMDYHISEGQAQIATLKVRDKYDLIIVQEKLDGSNVAVAKVNGQIIAITRSGYLATTSKYIQHHLFDTWVNQNKNRFFELLNEGERICGEWLAQAHGTIYELKHEPFVGFDLRTGKERVVFEELSIRTKKLDITLPHVLSYGPTSIQSVLELQGATGRTFFNAHGSIDGIEGAVWRVERKGKVDFLTKFVRHDKEDGKYLPEKNGSGEPIFNTWNGSPVNLLIK
ncbi:RNA ligase family protein [Chitinophaga nivalis]|uniref:RNA ligase family protein n=1 Tax=Chitinophaga nivalis TaxID=2991709 RepID=A0ABT3IIP2_9BACT|nr:RNA ligase family protein [Chitinophaga nivalis]MCW3466502.1 RNA ligase family protein [Chitinophaga nivalis]MCW3483807.1 RNA ligase family protein [Chitinophaga nivalis]